MQLNELLTPKEVKSLTAEFDLSGKLRGLNELAHFWHSTNNSRSGDHEYLGIRTIEESDLKANGYTLADEKVAVLFCARLVSRARQLELDLTRTHHHWEKSQELVLNKFSKAEREILEQLRFGMTHLRRGYLCIDDTGHLCTAPSRVYHRSGNSALLSPSPSQSE